MNIRRANITDSEALVDLHHQSWLSAYVNEAMGVTKEKIDALYANHTERVQRYQKLFSATAEEKTYPIWVAPLGERVVGFVAPRKDESGRNRLGALYVHPDFFGKGIGSALLEKVVEYYRGQTISLDVVTYNQRAKAFYEAKGFHYTGKHSTFSTTSGAIQMPMEEMEMQA
ncbi:hypothetical protein COW46_01165 [Candidatus Gracilibacteria bacterium CG17_big_fil_post_rev_8_21_14_2_50_48_13]|nr:MAG: hypothetical protein COW46_01165 [Candidatus Gracilibacteria bacterium CG17_big_fil_post_rev_8_21_14_2_50_48_13]